MVAFDGTGMPLMHVTAGLAAAPPNACIRGSGVRGTNVRGGIGMLEIPAADVMSVTITRGRDSDIDTATPGAATILLDNHSGDYDPTNPAGPYVIDDQDTLLSLGTFEATLDGWAAGGTVPPTLARDSTHAHGGTWAGKVTWATGGLFPQASHDLTGLRVGTGYRLVGWAYVPTGSPAVRWAVGTIPTVGDPTTVNDAFQKIEFVFVATSQTMSAQIWPVSAPTSGQAVWIDDLAVVEQRCLIDLGTPVEIQAEWPTGMLWDRFVGEISDIQVDAGYNPTVTLTCSDGLESLGRTQLPTEQPEFAGDTSGQRIGHLADRAGWPATARLIDTGQVTVAPTTLGASALELMRQVEQSELGLLYVDEHGNLVFYERHRTTNAARSVVVQAELTDTQGDGEAEMLALTLARSRDRIFNDAHVTRGDDPSQDPELTGSAPGDVPVEQVAQDTTSIATYGTLSFPTQVGQVLANDPDALGLAQGLVRLYGTPQVRIREVQIDATTLGLWSVLLPLGLLDRISVRRDYGPNTITGELLIQSTREEITDQPGWTFTFTTSEPPPPVHYCTRGEGVRGTDTRGW